MKHGISILILLFVVQHINSQINASWKGGTPGHESDWNTPANWSNNRIPDEFTNVTIPFDQTFLLNYPTIRHQKVEVHSIWLHKGAIVNFADKGELVVLHSDKTMMCPVQTGIYHSDLIRENDDGFLAKTP